MKKTTKRLMYPVSLARFLCVLSVFFVSSVVVALEECDEEFRFDNCFGSWTEHGETWAGEWRNDELHGQGTWTGANGEKYVGEWKDGEKHGKGKWTSADGQTYVGEWKNDNALSLLPEAQSGDIDVISTPSVKPASVTVHSNVQRTKVYIDGVLKGSTRLELDLPHGEHTIRIEKDGYQAYEETISLTDNLIIRGNLEKIVEQQTQTDSATKSALELTFWQSIKDSDDPDLYKEYLHQFPAGIYAGLAKITLRNLTGSEVAVTPKIPDRDYGHYHALVIGNNNYEELPDLKTAINDANRVAKVLKDQYGYSVTLIRDANRSQIIKSLSSYRKTTSKSDNVLIYYAGHGILDEDANKGYWLPVDAELEDPSNWILNDMLTAQLKAMQAKHVIVISDSCFSGTLTRGLKMEQRTPDWIDRMAKKRARTVLTSGGLEPVLDSGGGEHSVFAKAFITLLKENTEVVTASQLFSELRPKVMVNSPQTPQYGNIHQADHEGGDFLFVRQ
ncbi:MAG: PEGA domain-containing protein [Bacteroidetes Order II. Incertae sedis bacterium]|jgi:hypothetical protein|nr:PEGA domain-containing protein [Bacteroidetes Order II. bacterium]